MLGIIFNICFNVFLFRCVMVFLLMIFILIGEWDNRVGKWVFVMIMCLVLFIVLIIFLVGIFFIVVEIIFIISV